RRGRGRGRPPRLRTCPGPAGRPDPGQRCVLPGQRRHQPRPADRRRGRLAGLKVIRTHLSFALFRIMRWIHVLLYSACFVLLALASLFSFSSESKPFVDSYGNHASVLGLMVSVVGFALTLWTVLETLQVVSGQDNRCGFGQF